jgi:ABC-type uncharacterized transport system substrate-binding protein
MRRHLPHIVSAGLVAAGIFAAAPALAHPHVFVDGRTEVVFDAQGPITAIRNIWQFDQAFSEYAIQGLDVDDDGKLSDEELKPLAKVNVEALAEYDFFTFLTVGREKFAFTPPKEYWLEFRGGRLTLFYTLPLKEPVPVGKGLTLEIFDPEFRAFIEGQADLSPALRAAEAVPASAEPTMRRCRARCHPDQRDRRNWDGGRAAPSRHAVTATHRFEIAPSHSARSPSPCW